MKHSILAASVALALAGCGQQPQANAPAADTARTYSGAGKVTAVAGDQVSIAHGPIQGIGWPAMMMSFTAPAGMANGVKVGDQVSFSFRQQAGGYPLTSLQKR
jgi:Cu(I)/Ag(I) efflux system periplasmic protein CusF